MKNLILPALLLLLVACNSDKEYKKMIKIGDTDGMYIKELDTYFKGVFVGFSEVNKRTVKFDVNDDGVVDFTISSEVDSIPQISNIPSKIVSKITFDDEGENTKMNISRTTTNFEDLPATDTIVPPNNIVHELRHTLHTSCVDNSIGNNVLHVEKLNGGDELNSQKYNVYHVHNLFIYNTSYETIDAYNSNDFIENSYDYSCNNPNKNAPFYIGFTFGTVTGKFILGWIELEILDDETVHIIRTAAQE